MIQSVLQSALCHLLHFVLGRPGPQTSSTREGWLQVCKVLVVFVAPILYLHVYLDRSDGRGTLLLLG